MSTGNSQNVNLVNFGLYSQMDMTRENQLAVIEQGLERLGVSVLHFETKMAKVPSGTIRELRRGKRPMASDKWQKISTALGLGSQEKTFKVDEKLMSKALASIKAVADTTGVKLSDEEKMAYTVKLYNHIMKYRERGRSAEPNEATAELILQKIS